MKLLASIFRKSSFVQNTICLLSVVLFVLILSSFMAEAGGASVSLLENDIPHKESGGIQEMLQFTAGGHILGFKSDRIIMANRSYSLTTEFVGTAGVNPQSTEISVNSAKALLLSKVTYADLWNGVTLVYEQSPGGVVKSTYTVAPFADVNSIRLRYNVPIQVTPDGSIRYDFEAGYVSESAPVAWQEINGNKSPVSVSFRRIAEYEAGFETGRYNPEYPLIIDPIITWNTFLGAVNVDEVGGIAVDGSGNVYVSGTSYATWGSPVRPYSGSRDVYVAKLNSSGVLQWNTFLGSTDDDSVGAIVVDGTGDVYVAGNSKATWGSPLNSYSSGGQYAVFLAKLNILDGTLVWNTFIGTALLNRITIDGNHNVYLTGWSNVSWGSPVTPYAGGSDAFAVKIDSSGTLVWNTFMGSASGTEVGSGIAVDGTGNVYVTGWGNVDWGSPVNHHGNSGAINNAFVVKLDSSGALQWNTFMGSNLASADDGGHSIAVDGSGNVYVSGTSTSTWGTPINSFSGGTDIFIAKLDSLGHLDWNTFMGGSDYDDCRDITVDGSGNVYVSGTSYATWGFPINAFSGGKDALAVKLNSSGVRLWHTFIGSSGDDDGAYIAVDGGNVYIAGVSPATWGSPIRAYTENSDAFVVKLTNYADEPTTQASAVNFTSVTGSSVTINWNRGTGENCIVLMRPNSAVNINPTAGVTYTANAIFAHGSKIGTDIYVVYKGTGNSVTITGLPEGITYYTAVYEFNGSGGLENYLISSPAAGSQKTPYLAEINTYAGTGTAGFSGDNGPARLALLNYNYSAAADTLGNLFIADYSNHRIRKVNTSGIITTIAGTGTAGYSGDGGQATSAMLNSPTSVCVDTSGNLFIADYANHRIRKIDAATGIITTVAGTGTPGYSGNGGSATSATLHYPQGVFVDASGNIFIADSQSCLIRKINTSGIISTVAGNGYYGYSGDGGPAVSASLRYPVNVFADTSGNLFIADTYNNCIRKVDTSGIITTVAGTGTAGYSGDVGPAASAQLYFPFGVCVDTSGNLFIADYGNHRIRKVNTAGNISTIGGTGTAGYSGDGGSPTSAKLNYPTAVFMDINGNLFISDRSNNIIRRIFTPAAEPTTPASSVNFTAVTGTSMTVNWTMGNGESCLVVMSPNSAVNANPIDGITYTANTVFGKGSQIGTGNYVVYKGADTSVTVTGLTEGTTYFLATYEFNGANGIENFVAASPSLGYALDFNGGNDYVDVADGVYFNGDLTIEGWVYVRSYASWSRLIDFGNGPNSNNVLFALTSGTSGQPVFQIYSAAGYNSIASSTAIPLNTWTHLAVTLSRTTGIMYINGTRVAINTTMPIPANVTRTNCFIGRSNWSSDAYADAIFDEIRFWNIARTQSEIQQNMSKTLAGTETGLVAYYNFDSASGLTLTDITGGNHNGTLTNMTGAEWTSSSLHPDNQTTISSVVEIYTVAGTGTAGYSGDSGSAASAQLNKPQKVFADTSGNLFITDRYNNRIRKVNTSGIITTIAGTGTAGYSGDGGQAASAQLNDPCGVFVDASGNIFIADYQNHRIRKVDAVTGIITSVAGTGTAGFSGDGGSATSARLNGPVGVFADASGNIFISEWYNHRIRKVNTSGIISTVAGTGTAGFSGDGGLATSANLNNPYDIFADTSGNLFIADCPNHRIRKVDTSGIITTVAGIGTAGYSGDGGPAVSAQLNAPSGISIDSSGNLFIADTGNHRIRKVNTSGNISTLAGIGTSGYSGDGGSAASAMLYSPYGVSADNSGSLFIADSNNSVIRRIFTSVAEPTTQASSVSISSVTGTSMTINWTRGNGENCIVVMRPGSAVKVNPTDGMTHTANSIFGQGSKIGTGNYVVYKGTGSTVTVTGLPEGTAYYVSVYEFNGSGQIENYLTSLSEDSSQTSTSSALEINTFAGTGTAGYSGDGGTASSAALDGLYNVFMDTSGNLLIPDSINNLIRKVTPSGIISTVSISAQLGLPKGIFVDTSDNIFIADSGNNRIRMVNNTGLISTAAGTGTAGYSGDSGSATAAMLNQPVGVFADASGNLYIADQLNNRIRRVDVSSGYITTIAGNGTAGFSGDGGPAVSAQLNSPSHVFVDTSGNLFITDQNNHRIRKVDTSGNITTIAGTGTAGYSGDSCPAISAQLNTPASVFADASGNLYIADTGNHRIRKINPSGNISTLAGTGTAGYSGDGGLPVSAKLSSPVGVYMDNSGNLYIAEQGNSIIRRVFTPGAEPTTQASSVSFTDITTSSMTINWTAGNGTNRIVLIKAGSAVNSNPIDGISYTANSIFGSGSQIGTGNYVVYNGTGNFVVITGLTPGMAYYTAIYEFNASGGYENYLTGNPLTGFCFIPMPPPGNALSFDGVNDYVLASSLPWPIGSEITVEYWSYVASTDVQSTVSFSIGNQNVPNRCQAHAPWSDSILYWDYGASSNGRISAAYGPYLNKWTHVALVSKGNNGNFKGIYLDGILAASASNSDGPDIVLAGIRLGGDGSIFLKGKMDEFRVWNIVRTQTEIQQNMNKTLVGNETGLVAYYNFDHASGTTLYDIHGGGNNGTLTNMAGTEWSAAAWNYGYPYISTNAISGIAGDGATAGGNVIDEGVLSPVTDKGVCWNTAGSPTLSDSKISLGSGIGTFTGSISGLMPAQMYHVRAYAVNAAGTSYGNDITFTTLPAEPSTQASNVNFSSVSYNSMTVSWTNGNGGNRLVLIKAGSAVNADPVDAISYTANTAFSSGTQIGSGNYVVYNGTGTSVYVTGLSTGQIYYVAVYEYNGTGGTENYKAPGAVGFRSTLTTKPTTQASGVNFTSQGTDSLTVNWVNGNGAYHIVLMKSGSAVSSSPADGAAYTANAAFGSGTQIGTGNFVVYSGTASSVNVTGLTPGVIYYAAVFGFNGDGGSENYLTPGATGYKSTLSTEPTTQASGVNFISTTINTMTVSWTAGNGGNRIVLMKSGSAVDSAPIDGTTYTANANFGSGNVIGTGNYVIYTGTGASVFVTGLSAGQAYHVAVYEFSGASEIENYLAPGTAANNTTLYSEPMAQASGVNFTSVGTNSMTVKWTNGSGSSRIVLMKAGSAVSSNPTDGVSYTANAAFGSGALIGTGNYIVYSGTGSSVDLTGLTPGITYYAAVYEFNGSGGLENYLTPGAGGNKATLAAEPTTQASGVNFISTTINTMTVRWTAGNGTNRIVLMKSGSAVDSAPIDGTTYTSNSNFGSGNVIGTGNYVIYTGTGTSVSVTGLTTAQTYHVAVYEFSGSSGSENYLTPGAIGNNTTLFSEPVAQASGVNFTSVGTNSMTVKWTNGSGSSRIVLMKAVTAVDSTPTDGVTYTANSIFGNGSQIGTSNYVIYTGTASSVNVTGIAPGQTYYIAVFEYNGSNGTENYLITSPASGNQITIVAVYISNSTSNTVSVIDTSSNTVIATIPVGTTPYGVSVSPYRTRAYISNFGSNNVSVIDTASNSVIATISVGTNPYGIITSPDGNTVYAANNGSGSVSVINASTNSVTTTISVGAQPVGVAINPFGTTLYAANFGSGNVSVINTGTNTVTTTINTGTGSQPTGITVSPDGNKVYVANSGLNRLSVIDTAGMTVTSNITVGTNPRGVTISSDGLTGYASNYGSNTISVIDAVLNTVTATVTVGSSPAGISVSPDKTMVYVSNFDSADVSIVNTATNTVAGTVSVGANPYSIGNSMPTEFHPVNLPTVGYTADRVIPASVISQATDGSGKITIQFRIKHPSSTACTLKSFGYSTDGGAVWITPSDSSSSLSAGWQNKSGSKYSSAANWTGTVHSFTFNTKDSSVSANFINTDQSDIRIRFKANDGIYDSFFVISDNFRVDDQAPSSNSIVITDNSGYTNDSTPSLIISSSDLLAISMRLATSEAGLSSATWIPYAASYDSLNVSTGGDGIKTVWAEFRDAFGNAQTVHVSDTTTYDTAPPQTGIVMVMDKEGITNNPKPEMLLSSSGAGWARFAATEAELTNADWVPYSSKYSGYDISAGGDGAKFIWAEFKDLAGNIQQIHTVTSTYYLTTPPNSPLVSGTTPTNDSTPTWIWKPGGGGSGSYRCKLDDPDLSIGSFSITDTTYTPMNSLSEGSHTLYVQEKDSVGNWSSSGSFEILIDITLPSAPVISGPVYTNNSKPVWTWVSGGGGNGLFRYKQDNSNLTSGAAETNALSYTPDVPLVDGTHVLYVQERDSAGNWSSTALWSVVVDTVPPSSPSVQCPTPTNNSRPTWTWSSGGGGSGAFQYKLDDANFVSGVTDTTQTSFTPALALADGTHALYIRERDAAGNFSAIVGSTIVIDTALPKPPIVNGTTPTNTPKPEWSWVSSGASGTYRYKLDDSNFSIGATLTTATSFIPSVSLTSGAHVLYVQERNAAGNWSSSGMFTIEIDTTLPNSPTVVGTSPTNDTTPTWMWTTGGGNGTYRYKLDSSDLTSGSTLTTATWFTPVGALSSGVHVLNVQERDDAGNWSASGSFLIQIDTLSPNAPSVNGITPTNNTNPTWTWTSGGGGNGRFRYKLDGSNMDVGATETTGTSFTSIVSLSEGAHLLYVQETDPAGNWSTAGYFQIIVDVTPPNAPIIQGATPTNNNTPTWTWTSGGGGNGTFRYKIDNNDLTSGTVLTTISSFTPPVSLADGSHTLFVQERDVAGNWSGVGSYAIVVDTVLPNAPSVFGTTPTNDITPTWTWTSAGGNGKFRYKLDNSDLSTGATETTTTGFTPSGSLSSGKHVLYVQERDNAGNWSASGNFAIEIDILAPGTPSITGISPTNNTKPAWNWTSSGGGIGLFRYKLDGSNMDIGTIETSAMSFVPSIQLTEGTHALYVQEIDAAGNWSTPGYYQIVVDTTPPGIPVIQGPTPTNVKTPTWTWTSGGGGNGMFQYKLDNNDMTTGAVSTLVTSYTPTVPLTDGSHTLFVQERDAAGNWSGVASYAIVVDTILPNAPAVFGTTLTNDTTPTWTWASAGGNGKFRYKLDNSDLSTGATETTTTGFTPSGALSSGSHVLYVQERDNAGNWSAAGSFAVEIDTLAPGTPAVTGISPTNNTTPAWNWTSGGGGKGLFRYKLDGSNMDIGTTETTSVSFTPSTPLTEGTHTLYVQEADTAGNWSSSGYYQIIIDTTSPGVPVIYGSTPTNNSIPTWTWTSGGGGSGTYQYKLDDNDMSIGAVLTTLAFYMPAVPLAEGSHTLYVRECDAAGNWSGLGNYAIFIDITGPNAPTVNAASPTNDSTPTWYWTSGGNGSSAFRYKLDDSGTWIESAGTEYTPSGSLSDGNHTLTVQEKDSAGNWSASGSSVIRIDTVSPNPVNWSPMKTQVTTETCPIWTWVSDSLNPGVGTYRYKLDDSNLFNGATETVIPSYQPSAALPDGRHYLYVQERDEAGNWSVMSSYGLEIDTTAPGAPLIFGATPTNSSSPAWTWESGGGGSGIFRYKLNDGDLNTNSTQTVIRRFTPASDLSEGSYILYVQERDAAGNWSASGTFEIIIDKTLPNPPTVKGITPTNQNRPTWTWISGGSSGSGVFRSRLNNPNLDLSMESRETVFTPDSPLSDGVNTLYVQERDLAGNWSAAGSFTVTIDTGAPCSKAVSPKTVNVKHFTISYTFGDGYKGQLCDLKSTLSETVSGTGAAKVELYAKSPQSADFSLYSTDTGAEIDGIFDVILSAEGTWAFKTIAYDNAGNAEMKSGYDSDTFFSSKTAGYAILCVGSVADQEGLESHTKTASSIREHLIRRNFLEHEEKNHWNDTLDHIKLFTPYTAAPVTGKDDYSTNPTDGGSPIGYWDAIKYAVTEWAPARLTQIPAPLYLILLDHGSPDRFYLNGFSYISSSQMASWLDTLEEGLPSGYDFIKNPIVIMMGSCYSGSFIDNIAGTNRIIITSTAPDEVSFRGPATPGLYRDGEFFMTALFNELGKGLALSAAFGTSYDLTKIHTDSGTNEINPVYFDTALQHPQINVGSASSADSLVVGSGKKSEITITLAGRGKEVIPNRETGNPLWAKAEIRIDDVVQPTDPKKIKVWAEVRKPGFTMQSAGKTQVTSLWADLDPAELHWNDSVKLYEADYNDLFKEFGRYTLFFYAMDDTTGIISQPYQTYVYKTQGDANGDGIINLDDAVLIMKTLAGMNTTSQVYADADINGDGRVGLPEVAYILQKVNELSLRQFNLISPENDAIIHNNTVVLDWKYPPNPYGLELTFKVLIALSSDFSTPVIIKEWLQDSMYLITANDGLKDNKLYFWKVQAWDQSGTFTESETRQFKTNFTNVSLGTLTGYVRDDSSQLTLGNAVIRFIDASNKTVKQTFITDEDGVYYVQLAPGSYNISAALCGYVPFNRTGVTVQDGKTTRLQLPMTQRPLEDITGDGKMDLQDIVLSLQVLTGIQPATELNIGIDVNCDDRMGIEEVMYMMQKVGGLR